MRAPLPALALAVLLAAAATPARADGMDPRLAARLDSATAVAVHELVESARGHGLPTEPLIARALEGAGRGAAGPRIVAAVRNLSGGLDLARASLGDGSSDAELAAGAAALAAGVRQDTLAAFRAARREGSVVVPLVVLTDLVTRRVPVPAASAAVLAATRGRVRDTDLLRLREQVHEDIRSGTRPVRAVETHTRQLLRSARRAPAAPPAGGNGSRP